MIRLAEVDSTNRYLKELTDAPFGTAVLADRQTAGYGQRGRSWTSEAGDGMYLSVLLPLPHPPTLLPLAAGLAALEAVLPYAPEAGLKWVNDVVARGCKLGGVLVECAHGRAIVGVGLNLRTPAVEGAIGLAAFTSAVPAAEALAPAVIAGLERWTAIDPRMLLDAWRAHCVLLGLDVDVDGLRGVAEDVGPSGELLLRLADGTRRAVVSGTVRRPDGSYY